MSEARFSLFSSVADTNPQSITLDQFSEMVAGGEWSGKVSAVRSISDKKERDKVKAKLPAVTISGIFKGGHKATDLQTHSGLICMDFDGQDNPSLASGVEEMRERLTCDRHGRFAFVSAGGSGLAVICEIEPDNHTESFKELSCYYKKQYGLVADESCKDVSRLRFVSWDADAELNQQAERAVVTEALHSIIEKEPTVLGYYDTTVLCNNPVTDRLARSMEADRHTEAFERHPTYRLYNRIIAQQFSAKRGERNATLTKKLIPFLFGAVIEPVAMEWVEAFYWYNAGIFNDRVDQHIREARSAWYRCEANYRETLAEEEQEYFDYISTQNKADLLIPLFRICRSLSLVESAELPKGIFALSGEQCKLRLGLAHNEQGKRLLETLFKKYGVLDIDSYGMPRTKGSSKGVSNTYRWMIGS